MQCKKHKKLRMLYAPCECNAEPDKKLKSQLKTTLLSSFSGTDYSAPVIEDASSHNDRQGPKQSRVGGFKRHYWNYWLRHRLPGGWVGAGGEGGGNAVWTASTNFETGGRASSTLTDNFSIQSLYQCSFQNNRNVEQSRSSDPSICPLHMSFTIPQCPS